MSEQTDQTVEMANRTSFGEKDLINILLEEYKTLRAEMLERHSAIMQLISITGTGLAAVVTFSFVQKQFAAAIVILLSLVLIVGFGLLWLDNDLRLLSTRVREIENRINKLAGNDALLVWESTRGMNNLRYVDRIKQTLRQWKTRLVFPR